MPQIDFQPSDAGPTLSSSPSKQASSPSIDFQPISEDSGPSGKSPASYSKEETSKNRLQENSAPERARGQDSQKPGSTTGPTFSAAPRSLFQNIKDAFVGPGTTYGAAQSRRTGGPQENQFEKPLIDFQALTKGLNPPQQFGKAVLGGIQGAETFLSGLTTPRNAELFAAMGGISKAAPLVSRLVALGFSYSTLKQAFEQAPQFQEKVKAQDIQGAVKVLTEIGLSTALGTKLAMHGSAEIPGPTFEGEKAAPERAGRAAPESRTQTTSEAPPAAGRETARAPRVDFQPTGETKPAEHDTTVSKPTRDTSSVTLGFGLGALGEMDLSTPESEALKAQRKAALDAVEKAKDTPEQTNLAEKLRALLTGTRDFLRTWVNQKMVAQRRRVITDPIDREAMTIARGFKGREDELRQFIDGTHPWLSTPEIIKRILEDKPNATPEDIRKAQLLVAKIHEQFKPVMERALNPTEAMQRADPTFDRLAEQYLSMGQAVGILESSIDPASYAPNMINPGEGLLADAEYTADAYSPINERGKMVAGKIGLSFGNAKHRSYPTILHAIFDGLRPKTLDITDAFTIYGDKFATAFGTREWINAVADGNMGVWTTPDKAPRGWRQIAPHSKMFTKRATFPIRGEDTTKTEHATVEYGFYTTPFIEEAMRPLTDPDSTSKIMGFTKLRVYQAATKAMNLGWSLFHPKAEFLVASGSIGPVEAIKALAQMDRTGEIFLQGEREMSFEGGVPLGEAGGQRTFEAYRSLKPGAIPTQADIWKTKKGVRDAVKAADAITHFTFDTTAGRWKVYDYLVRKAAYLAKNPTATPDQLHAEMRRNTEYLNNAYGGIHWENRGWNRQTVNVMRAIIMAPDWVFSNVFTVKSAMMGWRKGTGASSRMFIARSAANGIAATVVTSILLNGPAKYYQVIDEDKKNIRRALTEVYTGDDKDGKHIWRQIYFGGAMSDIAQVVNKTADDGPVGILEYARNKLGPPWRPVIGLAANENYLHQEIYDREESWLVKARRQGVYTIGDLAPVPFWVLTAKDMLFGPDSEKYSPQEIFDTMLFASGAHHIAPPTGKPAKPGHFIESPEQLEATHKRQNYVRRIKAGDASVDAELDAQVDAGTMTVRQRQNLYRLASK